ncbi:uncharacterized protein A4U43_C03F12120 [Asparagus officinalis]|uniref:C3H1-type domain-containing protein n=1 Tax=Asparagus officinalis TaxID=4686 RepID=A0A5P1F9F7_ASPOF|nr:zinc finger CCCH domain-containing protein 7 [Asparagus officinalis]ONK74985.1 uncharacterized protein A4U43_C03F12120 [Asparagus officinalis]
MTTLNLFSSSCFTSRRSHLDSASYRTLVRIFSLCGGGSLDSSNPNPNIDGNPNSAAEEFVRQPSTKKDSVPRESGDGNCQLAEESGDGKRRNDEGGGIEKGVMNDCAKLFDAPEQDEFDASGNKKFENFEKTAIVETQDGSFGFKKQEKLGIEREKDVSSQEVEDPDECFNGESVERKREIGEGTQPEARTTADPLIECFGVRHVNADEINDEDFEEGEIPNDFEKPNESVDLMHEPAPYEDKKLEEGSVCEGFDKNQSLSYTMPTFSALNLTEGHYDQGLNAFGDNNCLEPEHKKSFRYTDDDVKQRAGVPDTLVLSTNKEKENPSRAEVAEVQFKKKRPVLTEERKVTKKKSKRRKRAQKEREQGVKRLKLLPVVKPKEVKYCNFYLAGRCQQGEACKFSHDTTPLTKSQPCKYLATDSCLKGDDCPFDHELSKYPCHNYMSKGMCIRGERCNFSHKMPMTEGSSPVSVKGKAADPSSLVSQPKSSTAWSSQLNIKKLSAGNLVDNAKLPTPISPQLIMKKPLTENSVNNLKLSTTISPPPPGIRFVSFGKGPSESGGNKPKGNWQQHKKEKLLAAAHNILSSQHKSFPAAAQSGTEANTNACKNKSDDGSLQTEVSEASKLLEEFLFCS